ncbi:dTDP-4-dehydrorhamnose 3,5-epimerase [Psychrobacillus sp. FSL H8-0510]|uniref:dTDP-4-dehydrorhamnose 3,5-epimerase n=1 Tax=Psychrobacillus sp. FSL H8-0510 TaxID=2921394 RepID=UPI0030FCD72B
MKLIKTIFDDAYLIETEVYKDYRGFFIESYNFQSFEKEGLHYNFIQDNHSLSKEVGTIRGLHYQIEPYDQTKLVRVIHGGIYEVIVDLRKGSPTYKQWQGFILLKDNNRQLLVPKGFAHGFCTLVPNTEVIYKVDNYYSAEHDRGIAWDDSTLNIPWPISNPILSEKDLQHPCINDADLHFIYKK